MSRVLDEYLLRHTEAYSEPGQRSKTGCFGKIIIVFNYFCKKHDIKSLRGF